MSIKPEDIISYTYINELLALDTPYLGFVYQDQPNLRLVLIETEQILREIALLQLLPPLIYKEELLLWLLNDSPLIEAEKRIIQFFAYHIDCY